MTAPAHSPLPWHSEADGHVYAVDGFSVTHPRIAEANARLIVAAVNSHAALLAATKNAEEAFLIDRQLTSGILSKRAAEALGTLQTAIANAEKGRT